MTEPVGQPRRRLHPLSPLLQGAKTLVVVVAGLSWSTLSRLGLGWFALTVAALALGAVALSAVSWYNTGYQLVGRELRIHEGLLWRRTRAIPLERLQAVEVVRPLLAQLTGLAELRLEVVGGAKAEAPLAYLTVAEAAELRDRLLQLAGRTRYVAGAGAGDAAAWAGPGTPADTIPAAGEAAPAGATGQVGPGVPGGGPAPAGPGGATLPAGPGGATLPAGPGGVRARGLPGALPWPAQVRPLHAVANRDLLISQLLTPQAFLLPFGVAFVIIQFLTEKSWSFVAVASTLTAIAGVLLRPVRRVLDDWNFRLGRDGDALRIRNGLVETRAQTVPLNRVQAIGVTWPLLWRVNDWLRLRLDIAGYAREETDDRNRSDRLLPVGELPVARMITAEVLPGVDLATLPLTPPPERARWLRPIGRSALGAGLTDRVFAARHGLLTRELMVVPVARIQSVRVVQGPVQRLLRLASVHADTAGGRGAAALHRDVLEAYELAAALATRARAARDRG
ncbi:PH domain-containing protein [Plantactinospora siamensis]|uniref:PH domain-containing protein n=1 Tax=Plantactinospora siamensis TaxID=555372 RepID=A0ABV6P100_9ACTN